MLVKAAPEGHQKQRGPAWFLEPQQYKAMENDMKTSLARGLCSFCGHEYKPPHFRGRGGTRLNECPVYKPHPMASRVGAEQLQYPVYVRLGWAMPQPDSEKK